MNVVAAKILENPREHRGVLSFGRIVDHGHGGVAETRAADQMRPEPSGAQQRAVGAEAL